MTESVAQFPKTARRPIRPCGRGRGRGRGLADRRAGRAQRLVAPRLLRTGRLQREPRGDGAVQGRLVHAHGHGVHGRDRGLRPRRDDRRAGDRRSRRRPLPSGPAPPRSWGWVPFNGANWACSVAAAAFVYGLLRELAVQAAADLPARSRAARVDALHRVSLALLVLSYAVEGTSSWRQVLAELLPAGAEVLPFAVLGFLLGRLYLSLGPAVMLLIIVPILIAREMFASYMRVKESHDETVGMLIHALEAKDRYTSGHSERVADYAALHRRRAELHAGPARAPALRGADARHRQARRAEPAAQQAGPPDARRVRAGARAREGQRADAEPHRLPAPDRGRLAQRQHPLRPRRPRPPDRAVHRDDRRRLRRDDLDPGLPQGAARRTSRSRSCATRPASSSTRPASRRSSTRSRSGARSTATASSATPNSTTRPVAGVGSAGLGDLLDGEASPERRPPSSVVRPDRAKRTDPRGRRLATIALTKRADQPFSARRRLPSNN